LRDHAAILAFDPGSRGVAVAASLHTDGARIFPLKFKKGEEHSYLHEPKSLRAAFDCFAASAYPLVVVEAVRGRGGWSAQSNFSFGVTVGAIVGMAAARDLRVVSVEPQTWQKAIAAEGAKGGQKDRSLAAYRRIFPHEPLPPRKDGTIDHNAIDALLIAYWGAVFLGREPPPWCFPKGG
jgi:hypothetical protein